MANRDYLKELLNNMQSSIDTINRKQDEQSKQLEQIHLQTQKTNGRVTTLERAVEALQKVGATVVRRGVKLPVINDKFLTLMALASVILVVIVAALLRVDISKVLQ